MSFAAAWELTPRSCRCATSRWKPRLLHRRGSFHSRSTSSSEEVVRALHSASRIVVCPSNPLLSVGPILSVPGLRGILHSLACPIIAVSPLIGGEALRGPLARLLADLGH